MNDPSHLLLVEDNEDDVELIERAVRRAGFAAPLHVVRDGEQAIDYLSARQDTDDGERKAMPAVTLLDLKLPRKSGFDVLEWRRAEPQLRRMPVVVLTSSNQQRDVERAYDLGANSYLVKPVATEALVEMVKAIGLYWVLMNRTVREA
jgi:CheY-like chemotaxis protein